MGWLFGAGLGWFMGGPLGAIVGAALQNALSQGEYTKIGENSRATNEETIFVANLVAIMTKICMADGHISREERGVIHNFFQKSLGYGGNELRIIDAMIDETDRRNPDLGQICASFRRFAKHEQSLILLDLAYNIATVDHVITAGEEQAIRELIAALGISEEEHIRIRNRHAIAKRSDHYMVLGLDSSASIQDIKKAYKALAKQYHPDKVSHLGGELVEFAHQKFQEINDSYQAVKNERGF